MIKIISIIMIWIITNSINAEDRCAISVIESQFEIPVILEIMESLEVVELAEMTLININGEMINVPFGKIHKSWLEIVDDYAVGDCIVKFTTNQESWKKLHGRRGYLLARNGKVLKSIVTGVN